MFGQSMEISEICLDSQLEISEICCGQNVSMLINVHLTSSAAKDHPLMEIQTTFHPRQNKNIKYD